MWAYTRLGYVECFVAWFLCSRAAGFPDYSIIVIAPPTAECMSRRCSCYLRGYDHAAARRIMLLDNAARRHCMMDV